MDIYPSILVDDYQEFEKRISLVQQEASFLHIDVGDGEFVPHKSFQDIEAMTNFPFTRPFELHLMIARPETTLLGWLKVPAQRFIIHWEALDSGDALLNILSQVRQAGKEFGIALNPQTPPDVLLPFLDELDLILVMGVEPGFSGQKFMPAIVNKITALSQKKFSGIIEVDGGMKKETIALVAQHGASAVAVSSALFDEADPEQALLTLTKQFI